MKRVFLILALSLLSLFMLTACFDSDGELATTGRPFEVEGLEIILSPNVGFTRFRNAQSNNDGAYVFYIPISVTNIGETSNGLTIGAVEVFSPAGFGLRDVAFELDRSFENTSIFLAGNIQPGVTKEGVIYVLYTGDGEYIVEFYDAFSETVEAISLTVNFDFSAVPEIVTEFGLGETFEFDGMEYVFFGEPSWGIIRDVHSDFYGEYYFAVEVTKRNISNGPRGFPWDIDIFAPAGNALPDISWDLEEYDIRDSNYILPGANYTGVLHVLYDEDGEYAIIFSNNLDAETITVNIQITLDPNDLPTFQTEFALNETFIFDDLEITIIDYIEWSVINDRWSNLHGRHIMILPVTVRNVGNLANSLNSEDVTMFGPDGIQLESLGFATTEDSVIRTGDFRPGAGIESIIHVLYDGDGEYVIEFSNLQSGNVYVIFNLIREEPQP